MLFSPCPVYPCLASSPLRANSVVVALEGHTLEILLIVVKILISRVCCDQNPLQRIPLVLRVLPEARTLCKYKPETQKRNINLPVIGFAWVIESSGTLVYARLGWAHAFLLDGGSRAYFL